ncbi:MAG: hypothetical protein JW891_15780 [Candidatus Lokiarchaeota archaeon]|nr:hypothetical protein [Candidatus Lokiarchaeota archaeon]
MVPEEPIEEEAFFEEIVKKTKTGVTFPKELRELLFDNDEEEVFFKLIVPKEQDKIILKIVSAEDAKKISWEIKSKKKAEEVDSEEPKKKKKKKDVKAGKPVPMWTEYFVYDFESQEKVKTILETAFYKFAEKPIDMDDAMGRIKYALVSFMSSTKTENAKLYYAVERFMLDVIRKFDQPNLLDWIFEKIVQNMDSKFLYELALLDLIEISLIFKRSEKAELYIFHVLKNIDSYDKSERYNIYNSFKQLVKKITNIEHEYGIERTQKIDLLLKEKLMEYGHGVQDNDYKIQIVELLEDLNYIELAYDLAKEIQMSLPQDSLKLEEVRKLVRRLKTTPITEDKIN